MRLAREHREAFEALDLRALDLAVPIGPLDEAQHDAPLRRAREFDDPLQHGIGALLIGLHDEADAVPALQAGVAAQGFQQVERDVEPLALLGVDVQADVPFAGAQREIAQARIELGHDAGALGAGIARMQRRELHRETGPFIDAAAVRRRADGVERRLVGFEIALGVLGGEGGLAEHVVGIAEALVLQRLRRGYGGLDGLAADELLAEHAHGGVDAGANDRRARAGDEARQHRAEALFIHGGDQPAGDQQAPGGGVDEGRGRLPDVIAPLAAAHLVGDQGVARRRVGDAQQRLGQAHQRDAFLAGERIFAHQALHQSACGAGA